MAVRPKETEAKIARRNRNGRLIGWALRLVGMTLRYELIDPHGLLFAPAPRIFAIWHNRLACGPVSYDHLFHRKSPLTGLISASGDGELLAAAMRVFGIESARGSRSRGGVQGSLGLLHALQSGSDICITPDGPRGPMYTLQPGLTRLARMSGLTIIPVRYTLSRKLTLKSWDAFQVPLPFSKLTMEIRAPIAVPPEGDLEEVNALLRQELGV